MMKPLTTTTRNVANGGRHPALRLLMALALMLGALGLALPSASAAQFGDSGDGVVNINQASPAQLTLLPGIGPKKADAIVTYREQHSFKKAVELARVKGIGLKTVRKLKSWLSVSGSTTLTKAPVTPPKEK